MIIKSLEIDQVSVEDMVKIKTLDKEHFPFPWTEELWRKSRSNNNYVIFHDPKCEAFAIFLLSPLEKLAHLTKIAVRAESRGQGLASSILNASHSQFRILGIERCILEVDTENTSAIALYDKHGYKKIHLSKKFYSNGADAHIMEKHL